MSRDYAFVVDAEVLDLFSECSKRERDELLRIFDALAGEPLQRGDFLQKDSSGRDLQVKRFGKWLVTFWPDQPVCELRVVKVKKLIP